MITPIQKEGVLSPKKGFGLKKVFWAPKIKEIDFVKNPNSVICWGVVKASATLMVSDL